MEAIRNGNHRKATASWRKAFKKQWKKLRDREIEPRNLEKYHTNPVMWTCACDAFLLSRFLICKHILYCYEPISNPVKFFSGVRRQRSSPFWVDEQLVLGQEFQKLAATANLNTLPDSGSESDAEPESESDINAEAIDEDKLVTIEEEPVKIDTKGLVSMVQSAIDISHEQEANGNIKFVEKFYCRKCDESTLVEEIQRFKN